MDNTENIENKTYSMGEIIRSYRDLTKLTQAELCIEINSYLASLGIEKSNVSQTSLAKYEAGSAISDYNVIRFLNDKILKTNVDTKAKVFSIIETVSSIIVTDGDDLEKLLQLKTKSQLIDFLYKHIRAPKNKLNKDLDIQAMNRIKEELNAFPESIIIDTNLNVTETQISCSANPTGLFLMYLIFSEIKTGASNEERYNLLVSYIKEPNSKFVPKKRVNKKDFIQLADYFTKSDWFKNLFPFPLEEVKESLQLDDLLYREEDSPTRKYTIISRYIDLFWIWILVECILHQQHIDLSFITPDWVTNHLNRIFGDSQNIDLLCINYQLLVKDPILSIAILYKYYPYKYLLYEPVQLYERLVSLITEDNKPLDFINQDTFLNRAKELIDNEAMDNNQKKNELFQLLQRYISMKDLAYQ